MLPSGRRCFASRGCELLHLFPVPHSLVNSEKMPVNVPPTVGRVLVKKSQECFRQTHMRDSALWLFATVSLLFGAVPARGVGLARNLTENGAAHPGCPEARARARAASQIHASRPPAPHARLAFISDVCRLTRMWTHAHAPLRHAPCGGCTRVGRTGNARWPDAAAHPLVEAAFQTHCARRCRLRLLGARPCRQHAAALIACVLRPDWCDSSAAVRRGPCATRT